PALRSPSAVIASARLGIAATRARWMRRHSSQSPKASAISWVRNMRLLRRVPGPAAWPDTACRGNGDHGARARDARDGSSMRLELVDQEAKLAIGPLIVGDGGRFGMSWQAEQFCRRYGTEWSMTALDGANITPEAAARPARTAENSDRPRRPVRQGRACAVGSGESPCIGPRAISLRSREQRHPHRTPAPRPTG